ncbi:DMT family transporter [Alcaligenes sp. 1735tsa3]|uniref:DMT family transporter n=1 Tax=Alcaligenes phenolicus TaxID=232846 RepID=A0ABV2BE27_9BURK|nr:MULTISPECIES: DMT family transporter [Alcaligenes]OQV33721.1 EamA family transporter [Alcaligenes phenolicus]USY26990.1 DMT family transporter [Alcaligenes sp. 1735tsa3]
MNRAGSRLAAYACLALSMSLVGSYIALTRPLVAALPVFLLAWLRFGIGAIAMLRWLRKPATEPALDLRTRGLIFLESFLGNFLFTLCMVTGISMTSAVSAGVILSAIPGMVALFSWYFLKESIGPRTWVSLALGMGGIALLALVQADDHGVGQLDPGKMWLGNALIFCAVLCESAYAVIGKRLTAVLSPKRISAIINLCSLALITPLGLYAAWDFDFTAPAGWIWPLLVFYSLAASVWTVWLWMTGVRSVPASQAAVFMVLMPLGTAAVGVLVLGESFTTVHVYAFILALAGLVLATLPTRSKSQTP